MLTQRIIGAFTFRKSVYAEVEHDPNFTTTAWVLAVVVLLAAPPLACRALQHLHEPHGTAPRPGRIYN